MKLDINDKKKARKSKYTNIKHCSTEQLLCQEKNQKRKKKNTLI